MNHSFHFGTTRIKNKTKLNLLKLRKKYKIIFVNPSKIYEKKKLQRYNVSNSVPFWTALLRIRYSITFHKEMFKMNTSLCYTKTLKIQLHI